MLQALLIAAVAAGAPLFAQATETWWGLAPCALCLWQRWPYWVAAGFALLAAVLPARGRRGMLTLAAIAVLVSGAIGVLHVGVEWGWWPSPLPGCQAPTARPGASIEDMLRSMPAAPTKPCDAPTYLIPGLPITMAGMNVLFAAALGLFTLAVARRQKAG